MSAAVLISVVVPVFNEETAIGPFVAAVQTVLNEVASGPEGPIDHEIVFVDDGSGDATAAAIRNAASDDPRVRGVLLSRNFGKEAAMTAGLAEAHGDAVIVMDVDLQDPPELVARMIERWRAGAKVVAARRIDRSADSALKRLTAGWFYRLHNRISAIRIPENVGDFRLLDRAAVDAVNALPENRRFMKGLFAWIGFNTEFVDFRRPARETGESKFSGWRLWRFAVEGITSFSELPLVVWTYIGFTVSMLALGFAGWIIVKTLAFGIDTPGYASTLVVTLFLGGMQLLGIGVLGEYIARIYDEAKRRPPYVIAERIDGDARPVAGQAEKPAMVRPLRTGK